MTPHLRTLAVLIATFIVNSPTLAESPAQPGVVEQSKQTASEAAGWARDKAKQGWDTTKAGANKAADWSQEKARQGWDATREGAGKAADWSADKAEKGVDATAKGVNRAADWTAEKVEKGTDWTKDKSQSLWERTKAFFSGDEPEKPQ